jgi:hypothetical protein
MNHPKWIAWCCLITLVALYIVGAVSHGSLRHEVQTLPLWGPIVFGFRGQSMAKWSGLACMSIWLVLMFMIWSFLVGWTHLLSGHFSPIEIGLTIVIGIVGAFVLFAALQLAALRLSFLPNIANQ